MHSNERHRFLARTHEFYGHNAESVLELLRQRKKSRYDPLKDNDGCKLALLFEGGAMGGIISAAAGAKIQELGYTYCFDTIYGTSSGALNAAYFTAGQAEVCLDVYLEDTRAPEFMGLWRWPDQVNVRWLAKRISEIGPRQLNVAKILSAPNELKISTTEVKTGKTRYFSNRLDRYDVIIPAITASGSTPVFVTHREVIDGQEYSDGLIREGIQAVAAVADGHTHLVGLLSNHVGRRKSVNLMRSFLEQALRIRFYPPDFQLAFHSQAIFYNDALDLLHLGGQNSSSLVICPDTNDIKLRRLEKDIKKISAVIESHMERVGAIISGDFTLAKHRHVQESDRYS